MLKRVLVRTAKMLIPLVAALGLTLVFTISIQATMDPLRVASVFIWLFLVLLGVWAIITPRGFFMYWQRWELVMYGLAEPPEFVIMLTRIGGWVFLILSVIGLMMTLIAK